MSKIEEKHMKRTFKIMKSTLRQQIRSWSNGQSLRKRWNRKQYQPSTQSEINRFAYEITLLMREYARLRGKDPEVHSLKKWS